MKKTILFSTLVLTQTLFATSLTIYDSNVALVSEHHEFDITKKREQLNVDNLPATLIANSVNAEFSNFVTPLTQTYQQATLNEKAIAELYVGKVVTVDNKRAAKLLSLHGNKALLQGANNEIFSKKVEVLSYPSMPQGVFKTPTLTFLVEANKRKKAILNLSYLANNISFSTDYILNITDKHANLQAWAEITNNSGKKFKNADITLLAGEVNRVHNQIHPVMYKAVSMDADLPVEAHHKAVAGYHAYKIPFSLTLNPSQQKRVQLFGAKNLKLTNHFIARTSNPLYMMGERSSAVVREIELSNIPTPLIKGQIRIYGTKEKRKLLLGEQNIANQPKNTPLTLRVGKDFDTKVKQKVLSRDDTKEELSARIEYTLINHSDSDKIFTLEVPFNRNKGSLIDSKEKYRFTKGNLATFTLKVKANSQRSFAAKFSTKRR